MTNANRRAAFERHTIRRWGWLGPVFYDVRILSGPVNTRPPRIVDGPTTGRTGVSSSGKRNPYEAASPSAGAAAPLREAHLYFFWNFSTRPAASTYFIFPVKYGCE